MLQVYEDIYKIAGLEQKQAGAFDAAYSHASAEGWTPDYQGSKQDGAEIDEAHPLEGDRRNGRSRAEHEQHIEDIGTQYVTECELALFLYDCNYVGGEFRQGSAYCKDGDGDEFIAEPGLLGYADR